MPSTTPLPKQAKWRIRAISEGRTCVDCGRAIAKHDVPRWKKEGKRCWLCQEQVDAINARQSYEHQYDHQDRAAAEDRSDGSWVGEE